MAYLHSKNIIHGNLHPNNILFDGYQAMIADSALFTVTGEKHRPQGNYGNDIADCPRHWSSRETSEADDVWAFGCLIMDIVLTWRDELWFNASRQSVGDIFRLRAGAFEDLRLKELVERCLNENPEERIGIKAVQDELRTICPKEAAIDYLHLSHPIVLAEVVATWIDWINACWELADRGYFVDGRGRPRTDSTFTCFFWRRGDPEFVELRMTRRSFYQKPKAAGSPSIDSRRDGQNTLVITMSNIPVGCEIVVPRLRELAENNKDFRAPHRW
jgi:serine/threonine protein kinase